MQSHLHKRMGRFAQIIYVDNLTTPIRHHVLNHAIYFAYLHLFSPPHLQKLKCIRKSPRARAVMGSLDHGSWGHRPGVSFRDTHITRFSSDVPAHSSSSSSGASPGGLSGRPAHRAEQHPSYSDITDPSILLSPEAAPSSARCVSDGPEMTSESESTSSGLFFSAGGRCRDTVFSAHTLGNRKRGSPVVLRPLTSRSGASSSVSRFRFSRGERRVGVLVRFRFLVLLRSGTGTQAVLGRTGSRISRRPSCWDGPHVTSRPGPGEASPGRPEGAGMGIGSNGHWTTLPGHCPVSADHRASPPGPCTVPHVCPARPRVLSPPPSGDVPRSGSVCGRQRSRAPGCVTSLNRAGLAGETRLRRVAVRYGCAALLRCAPPPIVHALFAVADAGNERRTGSAGRRRPGHSPVTVAARTASEGRS